MSPVQALGKYYDGLSGKPHEVMIGLSGSGLRITSPDGTLVKTWSFNEVQLLEDALPPQPAKLSSRKEPEARLFINPDRGWIRIKDKLPRSAFPRLTLPTNWFTFVGYFGLSVAAIIFLLFNIPKILEDSGRFIPMSIEDKLGKYAINTIINDPICIAPKGQAALETIVSRLKTGTTRDIDYTIQVVEDKFTLNALAAPGGHLLLFSRVIEKAETPEELAGIIAHEMAHIELYHPTRGLMRDTGLSVMLSMATGSADIARLAGTLTTMNYSREDESAADDKGQEILINSNIDPKFMALFFNQLLEEQYFQIKEEEENTEKTTKELESNEGNKGLEKYNKFTTALSYLSTHPQTKDRIASIKANTNMPAQTKPILSAKEFSALKNICSETR